MLFQPVASKCLPLGALGLSVSLIALSCSAHAQIQAANASTASLSSSGPPAVSVATRPKPAADHTKIFWNVSFNEGVQRDSSTGWSDIVTPGFSLRFGPHVSFVAALPWYPTLAAYTSVTSNGTTTTTLNQQHNVLGDGSISGFAGRNHGDLNFIAGASIGFPTGDQSLGVSAGKTTWHTGTHAEYSVGPFTPDVEAGIGNSSAFASHLVRKSYTAVGEMANFQLGTSIDLPRKLSLDLEGYEAMPIQSQTLFGTIERRNSHATGRGRRTLQGSNASGEDNGLNAGCEYPLTRKLTIGAEYDASVIQGTNIVAFSVNWVLRSPRKMDSDVPTSPIAQPGN